MVDAARISARGVAFAYGADIALSDVDLDVLAGDRLVLLGPNGGGKTTLVRLLLGLLRPQRGRVSFVRPPGVLRLGYVPQFPAFDRDFPIRLEEMVAQGLLGARPRRSVGEIRRAVDAALSRLGLERLRAAYLSELSGARPSARWSPARWSASPRRCSSTSRPLRSTRPRGAPSGSGSASCRPRPRSSW